MQSTTNEQMMHTKHNRFIAVAVFLTTLITYLTTVSPTVSFWDCGEYIAASYTLGVPHPPGNPLYVLLGRFFTIILPFFNEVAYRINLISVLCGAFTATLAYLIVVKAVVIWLGVPDTSWKRLTTYIGGIVGALFTAFGYTFWFSAVEASVYIPSMFFVILSTWLALKWYESKDADRDRLLMLVAYLVFLGIGIHMMSMIAMAPVFLFVIAVNEEKRKNWRLWLTAILLASVIYNVGWFLWLAPATLLFTLVMSLVEGRNQRKWRFCFWLAFFAILGYSVHAYIPIRSALNPIIDENHPVVRWHEGELQWRAFREFLERKQYGSENFILRMFHRRGALATQFGIDGHMGYGGFHLTQFFHFGPDISVDRNTGLFQTWGALGGTTRLLIYLIPTFLMLFGWGYLYQRNRQVAIMLIGLFLMGSVILVFYMNFADGTRAERRDYLQWLRIPADQRGQMPTVHREVRIRDYFFTSGFMFYGIWIGIAASCVLHFLFTHRDRFLRLTIAPVAAVLLAVSPALPFFQNYSINNRTNDWVPYDYAYNLLMSCEKDGILFTNGDNDTFPLWFLQEAVGIRRDVRIVNLSLLNTKWYIKQLKKLEPKVYITFSDDDIENRLGHQLNPWEEPFDYRMGGAGITVTVPGRQQRRALRVQDKMVLHIVDANKWRKPIHFAVTVANDNKMGLDPYLQMQGLVYRLMPEKVPEHDRMNVDKTLYMLDQVYSFRGLGNGEALMTETSFKLMSNYAAGFIQVAITLRRPLLQLKDRVDELEQAVVDTAEGSSDSLRAELANVRAEYDETLETVVSKMDQCVALMPWDWRPRVLRQEFLVSHGRFEEAQQRAREALVIEPDNPEYLKMMAQALTQLGKEEEASEVWRDVLRLEADSWEAYVRLARSYEERGLYDSALALMRQFQEAHPGDRRSRLMISRLEELKEQSTAPRSTDTESVSEPGIVLDTAP